MKSEEEKKRKSEPSMVIKNYKLNATLSKEYRPKFYVHIRKIRDPEGTK